MHPMGALSPFFPLNEAMQVFLIIRFWQIAHTAYAIKHRQNIIQFYISSLPCRADEE